MKIYGIDLSIIVIGLITAFIGYQFNYRAKKRESYQKELSNSYHEIYFPMYEQLQRIKSTEEMYEKHLLVDSFFEQYSGPHSKIKFIGSSFLLEFYYEFREIHRNYKKDKTSMNEENLFKKLEDFKIMIDDEFWDSHDIIYQDHLQFRSDSFKNPFIVQLLALARFLYHLSVFFVWLSTGYLYFAIWNEFVSIESFPAWWTVKDAIILLSSALVIFGSMLAIKSFAIKDNRRKNIILRKLKTKIKRLFRR